MFRHSVSCLCISWHGGGGRSQAWRRQPGLNQFPTHFGLRLRLPSPMQALTSFKLRGRLDAHSATDLLRGFSGAMASPSTQLQEEEEEPRPHNER